MTANSQLRRDANGHRRLFFLILLLATPRAVLAQGSPAEIAYEMVRRLDANRDGQLQPTEIPRQSRRGVLKLAREAGLDAERPIPIERLRKHLLKQSQKANPEKSGDKAASAPLADAAASPRSGFGRAGSRPEAKGFGKASPQTVLPEREPASASEQPSKERTQEVDAKAKARIRGYAKGLLKQFDKNKSGVLERDEWSKMRGDPERSDIDKDGRLTVDELAIRLTDYGKEAPSPPAQAKRVKTASKPRSASNRNTQQRRSYRFLTPTERLSESMPRSLRDKFLQMDEDGDGQVAMSEFATFWSQAKLTEFAELDQNNDGVITPAEYVFVKSVGSN